MKPVFKLLTQLTSQKFISRLTGKIAQSKLSRLFIRRFAQTYRINIQEAEKGIEEYTTLNEFFTRRLKKGARTIDPAPHTVISPVDAVVTGMGAIEQGTILNVKGQRYTIAEMLENHEKQSLFLNGHYIVLYLSPTDYHRIHTPISGEIKEHVHLLGKVYPVNDFGLRYMKRVLSRNERLITYIQNPETTIAVVKVGAMNVASIQLSDRLTSHQVEKGEELAYFEFGSTVVLLIQEGTFEFQEEIQEGSRVRMGEVLGRMVKQ